MSYARLVMGCAVFLGGLANLREPVGVLIGAIGLAAALHETAYVAAKYLGAVRAPGDAPDRGRTP